MTQTLHNAPAPPGATANTVAIQGIEGSYHHIAAQKYFGPDIGIEACNSFADIFGQMRAGAAHYGIMAIENSVAGSLLPNYALLRDSQFAIIGEVFLRIEHQLMSLPGQDLAALREVRSHPMALLQCRQFFQHYPQIQLVESKDTAQCARDLVQSQEKGVGVIASSLAAKRFGLSILQGGLEDHQRNFTRFLVLEQRNAALHSDTLVADKASICFHVGHHAGALAIVLSILAARGMNLTKIQSLPLVGREWEYIFHLDMEFADYAAFQDVMRALEAVTYGLRILGEYRRGVKPITVR